MFAGLLNKKLIMLVGWSVATSFIPALAVVEPIVKPIVAPSVEPQPRQPFSLFNSETMPVNYTIHHVVHNQYHNGKEHNGACYNKECCKCKKAVTYHRTYRRHRQRWWMRGPVRRVVSWPFRALRRCRRNR